MTDATRPFAVIDAVADDPPGSGRRTALGIVGVAILLGLLLTGAWIAVSRESGWRSAAIPPAPPAVAQQPAPETITIAVARADAPEQAPPIAPAIPETVFRTWPDLPRDWSPTEPGSTAQPDEDPREVGSRIDTIDTTAVSKAIARPVRPASPRRVAVRARQMRPPGPKWPTLLARIKPDPIDWRRAVFFGM